MYQYDQKPNTWFTEESTEILQLLKNTEYGVLVGRNNCGKSFILKILNQQIGQNASYLGPARYQNFNLLSSYTLNRRKKEERLNQFLQQFQRESLNVDNSPLSLQQAIAELSDEQREKLREIIKILLGTDLEILHTVPENSMSQKYISCGGHNISFTSSGFRLITTLITCLLDLDYNVFLIDEPELGISPEAQGILADFLFDRKHREKYFSHIETLIFATHSTMFLDRLNIGNNYQIEKRGDEISIRRIQTQAEFNNIHFFLLGNRFETLYLPSLIIVVEGKCDHKFIQRVLSVRYKNFQFSIISANSDGEVKHVINTAKALLTDIQRSPYRDRIIVVLDSVHTTGLVSTLVGMGVSKENIIVWTENGIEYFYPPKIIDSLYGTGENIQIQGDVVSRNGISYTKNELVDKVVDRVQEDTEMHIEFQNCFLAIVERRVGLSSS